MSIVNSHNVQIPVIDITESTDAVGDALLDAVKTYGFVFIKNLGLDFKPQEVKRTFELSQKFFDSSQEVKEECRISPNNKGWSSMHTEILDPEKQRVGDPKEAFNFGEFIKGKAQQPMPKPLLEHEAELSHFADLCHKLCIKILRLFAVGLKINPKDGGEEWFSSRHDPSIGPSGSILRLLHYPALTEEADYQPSIDIRAGAHSDYGSITLLFQQPNQPGLEILTPSNTWSSVPVTPSGTESDPSPPILVNIGDLLSYWTNGLLKSTVHRVIFPSEARVGGEDRYSIAYFCHPADDTNLVVVPSEMVRSKAEEHEGTANGKVISAAEHLKDRLAATYGWDKSAD